MADLIQQQHLNLPAILAGIQQRKQVEQEMQQRNELAPFLLQQARQRTEMGGLEMDQARRKMTDEADLRKMFEGAGGDIGKAADLLQQDPRFFAKGMEMRGKSDEMTMRKRKMEAQERIAAGFAADPNFKPNFGDLLALDPNDAMKLANGGGINSGLEPKVGINPASGKPAYFVQDQRGGTKWLDAGVPDSLQLVPGNEYRQPQVFDKRSGTLTQAGSAAPQVGVPAPSVEQDQMPQIDPMAPWAKINSPKEQDAVKGRVYAADSKRLDDAREEIRKGRAIMADLDRFGELNRKQATGGLQDRLVPFYFDQDKREMEAIQNRLGPAQRTPGSGASSDRDVRLFLSGIPSVTQEGPVNKNIRDQFEKQLNDVRAELAFKEKYLAEKGYLAGVEEAFEASKKGGVPRAAQQSGGQSLQFDTAPTQAGRDIDALAIRQQELAGADDPVLQAAIKRDIDRMQKSSMTGKAKQSTGPQPMPTKKEALVAGQSYRTPRGVARWNGQTFESE